MVNPVAGAYAEHVPLLVRLGRARARRSSSSRGVHHQAKDVESQLRIFREVTCAARILRHPALAAEEIHEVVRAIWREHRPGYLEIHRDMVDVEIPVPPSDPASGTAASRARGSDARKLARGGARDGGAPARREAAVLIGGIELFRDERRARRPASWPRSSARRS